MKRFVYIDNNQASRPIIFDCEAERISDADRKFEASIQLVNKDGENVGLVQAPWIGCQIREPAGT